MFFNKVSSLCLEMEVVLFQSTVCEYIRMSALS